MVGRRGMGELRQLEQQILDTGLMPDDLVIARPFVDAE